MKQNHLFGASYPKGIKTWKHGKIHTRLWLISFGAQSIRLRFRHVHFTPTFSRTDGLGWDEPLVAEASRRIAPSSSEPLDAPVLGVYRRYIIVCYNQPQIEISRCRMEFYITPMHIYIYIYICILGKNFVNINIYIYSLGVQDYF